MIKKIEKRKKKKEKESAPALLAALEAMVKTHGYTPTCPACKGARAAINKARGQQNSS